MRPAPASRLEALAAPHDDITNGLGRVVAYVGVATVLICFATVYLRYAFGIGFIWLQESYVWTHAAAIMFGSGYALLQGGFVRVDMVYNRMSQRAKAWVDLFGTLVFMGPFLWMMAYYGWSFFLASWRMGERSAYDAGLPGVYILKATLLAFVLLVGVQGIAMICRCLVVLLRRDGGCAAESPPGAA